MRIIDTRPPYATLPRLFLHAFCYLIAVTPCRLRPSRQHSPFFLAAKQKPRKTSRRQKEHLPRNTAIPPTRQGPRETAAKEKRNGAISEKTSRSRTPAAGGHQNQTECLWGRRTGTQKRSPIPSKTPPSSSTTAGTCSPGAPTPWAMTG